MKAFKSLVSSSSNAAFPSRQALEDYLVCALESRDEALHNASIEVKGHGKLHVKLTSKDPQTIQSGTKVTDVKGVLGEDSSEASRRSLIRRALQDPYEEYYIGPYQLRWKGTPSESVFDRYTTVGNVNNNIAPPSAVAKEGK